MTRSLHTSAECIGRRALMRRCLRGICLASLTGALGGCTSLASRPPDLASTRRRALEALGFVEVGDGWELDLSGRIAFAHDDAELSVESTETVAQIAKVLLRIGVEHVAVEGHTDNTGTEEHNLRLSQRRAEAVAQALIGKGFDAANIVRRGFGSTRAIADNATEAGRAKNRRATLIVASL